MSVPQVARLAHSAKAMSEFILGAHHGRPVASETAPQVAAAGTGAAAVMMLTSRDEHAAHGGVAEMISETGIVMSRAAIPPRATESGNALPRTNGRGESAVEYSTGTAIYYGSTIALQAIDPPPYARIRFCPDSLLTDRRTTEGSFVSVQGVNAERALRRRPRSRLCSPSGIRSGTKRVRARRHSVTEVFRRQILQTRVLFAMAIVCGFSWDVARSARESPAYA